MGAKHNRQYVELPSLHLEPPALSFGLLNEREEKLPRLGSFQYMTAWMAHQRSNVQRGSPSKWMGFCCLLQHRGRPIVRFSYRGL